MRRRNFGKTPWWQQALWALLLLLLLMGTLGQRLGRRAALPHPSHAAAAPARR
jgi:hypothetical protein